MWGGNLFILGRTILISPPPSPSDVYTSFSAEKLKSGRYYQALGYPWPNIGLNTGPQHSERASLQQIYVFLKPGRVGVIEAKYGSNMETGDGVFISLPATRDCKKPLFNQALPLLGEGEQV